MFRYVLWNVVLSALLAAGSYLGSRLSWYGYIPSYATAINVFIGGTTVLLYYLLWRSAGSRVFTPAYLATIVIKLIFFALFILVIIYLDRPAATANALYFLLCYLMYTILEIAFLFRRVNQAGPINR